MIMIFIINYDFLLGKSHVFILQVYSLLVIERSVPRASVAPYIF